jgi:hypothetical protein
VTARELLDLVGPFGPTVADGELVLEADPPPDLDAALCVLHTGVRAALTGRRWWGCASAKPRVVELSPAAPVPADIELLAVEGDDRWDRVHPDARLDHKEPFAPAPRIARSGRAT